MKASISAFLSGFRSRWGALAAAACAGPLSLQMMAPGFVTPWPERPVVTGLATIACAVALLLAFQVYLRRPAFEDHLVAVGLAVSAICLLTYLACWSMLLLDAEQTSNDGTPAAEIVAIRGFNRLPEISAHYPNDYENRKLWSEFQYDVESVWTGPSVTVARIGTLLAYLGFFFGLTFAVALLGARDKRSLKRSAKRVA